jgi:hypothetical protein
MVRAFDTRLQAMLRTPRQRDVQGALRGRPHAETARLHWLRSFAILPYRILDFETESIVE